MERTDKALAIGFQFHPEAAVVKHLDHAENRDSYMDYDTAISVFAWLLQRVSQPMEDAA